MEQLNIKLNHHPIIPFLNDTTNRMKFTFKQIIVFLLFFLVLYLIKERYIIKSEPIINVFLYPIALMVFLFYGQNFIYTPNEGFVFRGLGMSVEPSCSGLNFFIIALSTFVFFWLSDKNAHHKRYFIFILGIFATYFLTLFVNLLRIFSSILMLHVNVMDGIFARPMAHKIIGSIVFLGSLIIFSNLLFLFFKKYIYEKSTQS